MQIVLKGLTNLTPTHHLIRKVQRAIVRSLGAHQDALTPKSGGVAPIHMDFPRSAPRLLRAGLHGVVKYHRSAREIRETGATLAHLRRQYFIIPDKPGCRPHFTDIIRGRTQ